MTQIYISNLNSSVEVFENNKTPSTKISNLSASYDVVNNGYSPSSKISNYSISVDISDTFVTPSSIVSNFSISLEVDGDSSLVKKGFNIYLGTIPISKIYLGNNNISEVIL